MTEITFNDLTEQMDEFDRSLGLLKEATERVDTIQWHVSTMVQKAIEYPAVRGYVTEVLTMLSDSLKQKVELLKEGLDDETEEGSSEGYPEWSVTSDADTEDAFEEEDV